MRIRRRSAPSFSVPTAPFSDLQLHRSEGALPSAQPSNPREQPSDQSMATCNRNKRWVSPNNDETHDKMKEKFLNEFGDDDETWRLEEKDINDDIRKIVTICDGEEGTDKAVLPSSSSAQEGSWCEGDHKTVPLKKRKGSFERHPSEERMSAKMECKMNKKCGDVMQVDQTPVIEGNGVNNSSNSFGAVEKSTRGNVIMEGSRCSRVNGRGWRCCQPTLVGYSLCEHHLGKGRLRSMAGVPRRTDVDGGGGAKPTPCGEDDPTKQRQPPQQTLIATKKRTKVGVVKARSMRSLLSQI